MKDLVLHRKFETEKVLPSKRLIIGKPVFTIKIAQNGVFACAGEKGEIVIANST